MKNKKSMVILIFVIAINLFLGFNIIALAETTTGIVKTSDLRLRKEESTSSDILALLDENDKVEIISENGDWYKVKADGKEGYVNKSFIEVKGSNQNTNTNNTAPNENTVSNNTDVQNNTETDNTDNNAQNNTTDNSVVAQEENKEDSNQENEVKSKIQQVKITTESQIRIVPLINGDVLNTVQKEEKFETVNNVGAWTYIKNDSKSGWVLTDKLTVVTKTTDNENKTSETDTTANTEPTKTETTEKSYSSSKTYYVKGTSVNARSEANKTSSVVKKLNTNEEVTVTGEDGDWYIVKINGKKAYILKTLLSSKKTEVTSRSSTSLDENNNTSSEANNTVEETNNESKTETAASNTSSKSGEAVVAYAKSFVGYPYVYGTNGPSTFDCSGFVQYVYKHFGYSLSRSSSTQANDGVAVSKNNLQPGDVLIFRNTANTAIGHVGIYIGNDQFVHASSAKTGVKISTLSSASYQKRYVTARRIL